MTLELLLLQSFWFVAPAYAANGFPPLMRGKMPIDGRRRFRGQRLLGDGKTWEGLIGGIVFGVFIGSLQIFGQDYLPLELGLTAMTFPIIFLLTLGTMAGDVGGSFVKRRMGMKRGDRALFLDQLGFLLMAFLFVWPFYKAPLDVMIVLVLLTPVIHWLSNVLGYWFHVKRNPW
ncbi:MAG: CDP-2,3-bis-(O-geranylgeranyl)-sn-glycerol synthase [Candidatus Aenigmarchaeota archaeon]|nr:CDP-2,3-bis-(O-geranylgeranyl)-sn-glycerol synthase [Candidatus Aenigmarchaeota archaeon]